MNEVVIRYINPLKEMRYEPIQCSDYFHRSHLMWMLEQILHNETQSLTKKHRWLGFVQGVLCLQGTLDVDTERNLTCNIFNGD